MPNSPSAAASHRDGLSGVAVGAMTESSDPRTAFAEFMDSTNETISELRRDMADLEAEKKREAEANSLRDARREETARNGELGPDWQKIQQRIDLGQTSVHKVLSGEDRSEAAQALRETAADNLSSMFEENAQRVGKGEAPEILNDYIQGRELDAINSAAGVVSGTISIGTNAEQFNNQGHQRQEKESLINGTNDSFGAHSLSSSGSNAGSSVQELEGPSGRIGTVPVSTEGDFGNDLKWKAGYLLGGLDWIIAQLTGEGLIG